MSSTMNVPVQPDQASFADLLALCLPADGVPDATNADPAVRIVLPERESDWLASVHEGVCVRVLEYDPVAERFTAQIRLDHRDRPVPLCLSAGIEVLLQRGSLDDATHHYRAGTYLRNPVPVDGEAPPLPLELTAASDAWSSPAALLYLSAGDIDASDREVRRIDTRDESRWLPGPVAGTEVLPLHVHGSSNAMLIRWLDHAGFTPNLDPQGEEILVLEGQLRDDQGVYQRNTWLRNPVEAWQAWTGFRGTLVYYKNGHLLRA